MSRAGRLVPAPVAPPKPPKKYAPPLPPLQPPLPPLQQPLEPPPPLDFADALHPPEVFSDESVRVSRRRLHYSSR